MTNTHKIKYLLIFLPFVIFRQLIAQSDEDIGYRHCGTFEYNKSMQIKRPGNRIINQPVKIDKAGKPIAPANKICD